MLAEIDGIDVATQKVHTTDQAFFRYDYLVLATGVTHSYFAHPEWAEVAPGLKTIEDAIEIRSRILLSFERAERATSEQDRLSFLTFVIVGGGPTGVELAGSIADIARNVLAKDFRVIRPDSARIMLIEAGNRILPTFPPELSCYAHKSLESLGVDVMTGSPVIQCEGDHVSIATGKIIYSHCILWAAGVQASPVARWLNTISDKTGRVEVDPYLRIKSYSNIFAIGDVARSECGSIIVPGLAPAAKQMGQFVGRYLSATMQGKNNISPFQYRHRGDLAAIGRRSAVVAFGRLKLKGFIAWLAWSVAHIYFIIGARNRAVVAINWMWEYLTSQRGARLISK